MDEADIADVVRHLVEKERRAAPVYERVLEVGLAQLPALLRRQLGEHRRVGRRLPGLATAKLVHQTRQVRELTRAINLGVRGQDLLDEGGTRTWHADDKDRIRSRAAKAAPRGEELGRAHLRLALHGADREVRPRV